MNTTGDGTVFTALQIQKKERGARDETPYPHYTKLSDSFATMPLGAFQMPVAVGLLPNPYLSSPLEIGRALTYHKRIWLSAVIAPNSERAYPSRRVEAKQCRCFLRVMTSRSFLAHPNRSS